MLLQQISRDCTSSERQDSVARPTEAQMRQVEPEFANRRERNTSTDIIGSRQPIVKTTLVDNLSDIRNRLLFSSHPALSAVNSGGPRQAVIPSVSSSFGNSGHRHTAVVGQNTLRPSFQPTVSATSIAGTGRPPSFAAATPSLFPTPQQSLQQISASNEVPTVTQKSRESPSCVISRLREKMGRGWLPPEPPYPPPPDDSPPPESSFAAESTMTVLSPREVSSASGRPDSKFGQKSEISVKLPQVDSTDEVTTTTRVGDDGNRPGSRTTTTLPKRPIEREDGEISDDEPHSVGDDLPPDSSGIPSSDSHWSRSRPPSFRGFRGGGAMVYRPRFPYRGRLLPRGRGFFRGGRGFAPWRQWYDRPDQHPDRDWGAPSNEHVVDSSGTRSPEMQRKQSSSSLHSPISSSDSEHAETAPQSRLDQHSSSRRVDRMQKSKRDDHLTVSSTRTSIIPSPEFEPSSESDTEKVSHSSTSKKKVWRCAIKCSKILTGNLCNLIPLLVRKKN